MYCKSRGKHILLVKSRTESACRIQRAYRLNNKKALLGKILSLNLLRTIESLNCVDQRHLTALVIQATFLMLNAHSRRECRRHYGSIVKTDLDEIFRFDQCYVKFNTLAASQTKTDKANDEAHYNQMNSLQISLSSSSGSYLASKLEKNQKKTELHHMMHIDSMHSFFEEQSILTKQILASPIRLERQASLLKANVTKQNYKSQYLNSTLSFSLLAFLVRNAHHITRMREITPDWYELGYYYASQLSEFDRGPYIPESHICNILVLFSTLMLVAPLQMALFIYFSRVYSYLLRIFSASLPVASNEIPKYEDGKLDRETCSGRIEGSLLTQLHWFLKSVLNSLNAYLCQYHCSIDEKVALGIFLTDSAFLAMISNFSPSMLETTWSILNIICSNKLNGLDLDIDAVMVPVIQHRILLSYDPVYLFCRHNYYSVQLPIDDINYRLLSVILIACKKSNSNLKFDGMKSRCHTSLCHEFLSHNSSNFQSMATHKLQAGDLPTFLVSWFQLVNKASPSQADNNQLRQRIARLVLICHRFVVISNDFFSRLRQNQSDNFLPDEALLCTIQRKLGLESKMKDLHKTRIICQQICMKQSMIEGILESGTCRYQNIHQICRMFFHVSTCHYKRTIVERKFLDEALLKSIESMPTNSMQQHGATITESTELASPGFEMDEEGTSLDLDSSPLCGDILREYDMFMEFARGPFLFLTVKPHTLMRFARSHVMVDSLVEWLRQLVQHLPRFSEQQLTQTFEDLFDNRDNFVAWDVYAMTVLSMILLVQSQPSYDPKWRTEIWPRTGETGSMDNRLESFNIIDIIYCLSHLLVVFFYKTQIRQSIVRSCDKLEAALFHTLARSLTLLHASMSKIFSNSSIWIVSHPRILLPLPVLQFKIDELQHISRPSMAPLDLMTKKFGVASASALCHQLVHFPFTLDLPSRVALMNIFLTASYSQAYSNANSYELMVRRNYFIQDACGIIEHFRAHQDFDRPIIRFVDENNTIEAGIDGGGLYNEFLSELMKELFDPSNNLFVELPDHTLIPKSHKAPFPLYVENLYILTGFVIREALLRNATVGAMLNPTFCHFLMYGCEADDEAIAYRNQYLTLGFEDLYHFDAELFHQLKILLNKNDTELGALHLNFSCTQQISQNEYIEVDLVTNGQSICVNRDNVAQYAAALAYYHLATRFNPVAMYMRKAIPLQTINYLKIFDHFELSQMLCGENDLDICDLFQNINYQGGYTAASETIKFLRELLENDFTADMRKKFLMFVTSRSHAPFPNFSMLHPSFTIAHIDNRSMLPTAATCINALYLPDYRDKKMLLEKLEYALNDCTGFHLG